MDENYEYKEKSELYHYAYPKKKKGWTPLKITALVLSCIILGGCLGAAGSYLGNYLWQNQGVVPEKENTVQMLQGIRENAVIELVSVETGKLMTQAEVYAANVNSTVGITSAGTTNFWGYQTPTAAAGSGFIISTDGYIITNHHVIEDSDTITVSLYDGTSYDAKLVGYYESSDIAVLKVEAENLVPVILGDSDNMNVGDSVVAIGNPLGELTFTLTSGSVSALNRAVTFSGNVTMDLIQTDCAINSGNSGGALFNLYGEVIGITNAKYSSSGSEASIDNIGFAIPINDVKAIVESIIENGYIKKPYIGISVAGVSSEAQQYGLPKGAAVIEVAKDGPAAKGGLQKNDIITAINGENVESGNDVTDIVGAVSAGDELKLTVYRQGGSIELTIVVGETTQEALPKKGQNVQQSIPGFSWGFSD